MRKDLFKSKVTWDTILVIVVFLCAFVIPVFPVSWGRTPIRIAFTLIFLSGLMTMSNRPLTILYLSGAAFIMEWVSGVLELIIIADISRTLNIVFFYFVIISLIREMATAKIVTTRVIMSSISGYLLLGIIYSVLIAAIIQRDPGAFNIVVKDTGINDASSHLSESMYFGFVTLATLGYGDIVPLKPYSRSLATLICISGQLYIATIIGILIGKYAATDSTQSNQDKNP
jgi:voltage-gated potassium channel